LNGQLNTEDRRLLNERLRTDERARRDFAEMLNTDAALAVAAASWKEGAAAGSNRRSRIVLFGALAAVVAMLVVGLMVSGGWVRGTPETSTPQPFATVMNSAGAEVQVNATIRDEPQDLKTGVVEFLTGHGTKVIVEAPAAFRFESPRLLRLERGRVLAVVPPEDQGFTVLTPAGDFVDQGTEFGVEVSKDGAAEVHVYKGEVVAKPKGGSPEVSITGGQAAAVPAGGGPVGEVTPSREGRFVQSEEVKSLSEGRNRPGRDAEAEGMRADLVQDPALLVWMDFEKEALPEGQFNVVQGRLPGSRAAEFLKRGDHIVLNAGAGRAWPEVTFAAWVRLEKVGKQYRSIYHTKDWEIPGMAHWLINDLAFMHLGINAHQAAQGFESPYGQPNSKTPLLNDPGRWMHLAVVYQAEKRLVRFYLNGKLDHEVPLVVAPPALLGEAQLGNWNAGDRELNGRLDDFLLLGRALTDEEIRALHAAGDPYN
jgi:hypothetical protein